MVTRAGRYGRTPFKGHRGVTQGDTISPTIFNMVVDAVIHYWVTLVAGEESGSYGFGRAVQWMEDFFNADDVLLDSPRLVMIQTELDVLRFLNRLVPQKNINKSVGVVFQP